MASSLNSSGSGFLGLFNGTAGSAQSKDGITIKTFGLNIAIGLALFLFEVTAFFLLKSSDIGRRLYQPKTYLVQDRLRVEAVSANPLKWLYKIFTITDAELKIKCGLDGYFFIRFLRAMIIIFVPLMAIIATILLPINYNGGKDNGVFDVGGKNYSYNVTGLDTLSWQNVAPTHTDRYWAHLICALLAISWTLYRIYREKRHFIEVRQQFLTSPEHRMKASARTILITNIPHEYRSVEALEALFDVFVDNDDRSKLQVWLNRDYGSLRALIQRRQKLCHALEKEELKILRMVNKKYDKDGDVQPEKERLQPVALTSAAPEDGKDAASKPTYQQISALFEADCQERQKLWQEYLKSSTEAQVTIAEDGAGGWKPVSSLKFWYRGSKRSVPKIAWLRAQIAHLTLQIEEMLPNLDDVGRFKRQNSAFVQFDRQMAAHMACSLVSHHMPGRMTPRFLDVAPHEILWPNMDVTSFQRFFRTCIALFLFLTMVFLWGVPTTFLGFLSQLDSLRASTKWLHWLLPWPSWIISLISGPLTTILLALLIQLVVPALCRKLAVLVGSPTRSRREVITQRFYFTFLFIELVLVTSISSGLVATIPTIVKNPTSIPTTLATDLPKAANYFFNYLIIQALGFSGSVLFQYLRVLYITLIWPFFTQTPREEAWLQTTIPHQMWGNVYPLFTNFAAIGLIYSVISPLILIFISANFTLFWIAYRHNYYYVQRNKVDTHGTLFETALSQLFSGIYVLEIALIGLFFLVRNSDNKIACTPQAIIMIIAFLLTATFHYLLEQSLGPLYQLLPVTLEDSAADAERSRFLTGNDGAKTDEQNEVRGADSVELSIAASDLVQPDPGNSLDGHIDKGVTEGSGRVPKGTMAGTAANARRALLRMKKKTVTRLASSQPNIPIGPDVSKRRKLAAELGAAIAGFPDELTDLSAEELKAELKAAYQDPVTRVPAPVIWIPQDPAGISNDDLRQVRKYGRLLQYSNTGAYLTENNKCEITQPAPDVRPDWLLDWVL